MARLPPATKGPKSQVRGGSSVAAQVVPSRGPALVRAPGTLPPPLPGPTDPLTVLEEALLVQHGDGIDAKQGRLQQRVQRKGHGRREPTRRPTDSSAAAAGDVAPPQPALSYGSP